MSALSKNFLFFLTFFSGLTGLAIFALVTVALLLSSYL
jgi:hypothetical protein